MCNYTFTKILSLYLLLFLICEKLEAQDSNYTVPDSVSYISYQTYFEKLQKRDSVLIFYKPEWFTNKKINSAFVNLKLEDALSHVRRINKLSILKVDQQSIVFVPFQASGFSPTGKENLDALLIGDANEYGKYSKATINGKIVDGKSGEPLAGATVYAESLKISTITDGEGKFSMVLPVGDYQIKLTYVGYEENTRKIKLVSDGEANFELFEKSVKINEVVISAERAEFNVTGTQMSLLHLNAKSIREMPVSLGETDIIKSLSLLPGIQTAGEFGTGFNVRGGGSDQNLILVEDVPLFNSSHLFGLSSAIDPDQVSSVTLLKAGIPARYGERASSVMDIRLGKDNSDKVRAKGGIGLLNSRLSLQIPMFDNKASLLLGGRSSYSNWLLHQMPDIDLMNSSAGFYDLNALFAYNLNPNNKVTLFGYYSNDKFAFSTDTHYDYSNLLGSVRWTHLFNKRISSSLLTGYSQYNYSVNESDSLHQPDAYQINLNTKYNNLKWNFAWLPNDKHSIDFGINAVLYRIMPGEEIPFGPESLIKPFKVQSEKGLEMAAYVSDNFDILPKLNAELGLRFVQYYSLGAGTVLTFRPGDPRSLETIQDSIFYKNNQIIHQYNGIEPRLALRYNLDDMSSIKWSYNRMDQFINLISNNLVMSPTDTWTLSTTNLKPLVSDQYAIGYFRNFEQNSYELSIEAYYKTLTNVIEYKNGAQVLLNDHIVTDLLSAKGYGYGIELYAKKNSGKVTGWISYTYSRSMLKTSGASEEEQINGNHYYPSNFDKPHNLVLDANYHFSRRWRFSGTFTYNTGRPITLPELKYSFNGNQLIYYSDRNKYRLPDYHRLDIAITFDENLKLKKMWKGSWTLSVINVYGRKNAYSEFYAKEDSRYYQSVGNTGLYMLYIIGIPFPTLTYNFTF
jgi:hypothetical protein